MSYSNISFRITDDLLDRTKKVAVHDHRSQSGLMRHALEQYILVREKEIKKR